MPREIVDKAGLKDGMRLAVSVITEIGNSETCSDAPLGKAKIAFTKVMCDPEYAYTYECAPMASDSNLEQCMCIGSAMRSMRKSVGKKLSGLGATHRTKDHTFIHQPPMVRQAKQMIAEFAIFANSTVAYYLHEMSRVSHDISTGIFRACNTDGQLVGMDVSATALLETIIDRGITAEYTSIVGSHDLVGFPLYCHFTSPIRRAVDCICHFLLKAAYLGLHPPFTPEWLSLTSQRLDVLTRMERKLQFADAKLRTIQAMNNILHKAPYAIDLRVRITGYTGLFVNMMLDRIDDKFDIHVSYVLRVGRDWPLFQSYFKDHPKHIIKVTRVNIPGRFDEGTIPELDYFIRNSPFV